MEVVWFLEFAPPPAGSCCPASHESPAAARRVTPRAVPAGSSVTVTVTGQGNSEAVDGILFQIARVSALSDSNSSRIHLQN